MSMMEGKNGRKEGQGSHGCIQSYDNTDVLNLSSWAKSEGEDMWWLVNNKFSYLLESQKIKSLEGNKE